MPSIAARDPPASGESDMPKDPPAASAAEPPATPTGDTTNVTMTTPTQTTRTSTDSNSAAADTTAQNPNPLTPMEQARQVSELMTKDILLADQERAYQTLLKTHDDLQAQTASQTTQIATFQGSITELERQLKEAQTKAQEVNMQKEIEERKAEQWKKVEGEGKERMARVEVENDSLRQEIRYVTIDSCVGFVEAHTLGLSCLIIFLVCPTQSS